MFLISGLRPTTGVYISIFKVDLVENKRLIELGYGMDITAFNLLFKLKIYSSCVASLSYVVSIVFTSFSSSYLLPRKFKKNI